MHALSLGTVLLARSPPLFRQCGSGFSANVAGRRPTRDFGQIMMHTLSLGTVHLTSSPPLFSSAGAAVART